MWGGGGGGGAHIDIDQISAVMLFFHLPIFEASVKAKNTDGGNLAIVDDKKPTFLSCKS